LINANLSRVKAECDSMRTFLKTKTIANLRYLRN
jgi:hypothetical protein